MYTFGNPLRYSDPTGHDLWDAIDTVVDFAQGVGAQVGYNNTVIAVPSAINVYTPQANESTAMQVGRFVGNVVTTVQGGAEMITGVTLGSGGATACATGVGCLAGVPAIASGAAVVAHGGTVATISAANAGAQLGNLYNAVMEGGSGNSDRIHSVEKSIRSLENRVVEHEKKLQDFVANPDAYDNKGFLKNAPSPEVRESIIRGRVNHLTKEIQGWREQIGKLQQQLEELRNQ